MSTGFKLWKITLLLLFGLFVFLYIAGNTVADIYTLTDPVIGIYTKVDDANNLVVASVVPGGPADKAGINPGDKIVALNRVALSGEDRILNLLKSFNVSRKVQVEVSRNGDVREFEVPILRRLNVYTQLTISLLPGIIFCYTLFILGVFVYLKKINDRLVHIFYLMVMFWALAMWGTFPNSLETLATILPSWYDWLRLPFWPMAVALLLHFSLLFPVEKKVFQKHPRLILALVYSPLLLIVPFIYADVYNLAWGNYVLQYGWSSAFFISFILATELLGKCRNEEENPHVAKQSQIMYWGTLLFLAIPVGYYFIPQAFLKARAPFSEYVLFILILWPLTLAYVIIKHRFMDIDIIVKRGVAYALLSGFVIAAYFLLVVVVGKFVLKVTDSTNQLVTILATLFIAALFNPVKNRIQNFVDRRFFPNRFRYREAIKEFRHKLVNIVDLKKLFDVLLNFLADRMHIKVIVILWKSPETGLFSVSTCRGISLPEKITFSADDAVVKRAQEKQHLVDLAPLKDDPHHFSAAEITRWRSLRAELVHPLLYKGELKGLLSIGPKSDDQPFYSEDVDLLETLGDQINISLENALLTEELREQDRLKKELEVAHRIQLSTLPQSDPQIPGLEISGISIPAMEVGGDYYDYLDFPDGRFGVVVGDVSGKGTSAALYMSQLKGVLKTAAKFHKTLKGLVTEVNAITFPNIEETSFITLTCGAFDLAEKKMTLVRAGHLPLIHYCARDKSCVQLAPRGIGIGLENGTIFETQIEEFEMSYQPGDVFVFYSDGITEARNTRGEEFEAHLSHLIVENGFETASGLRQKIIGGVMDFATGTPQLDDMTLVVVKAI